MNDDAAKWIKEQIVELVFAQSENWSMPHIFREDRSASKKKLLKRIENDKQFRGQYAFADPGEEFVFYLSPENGAIFVRKLSERMLEVVMIHQVQGPSTQCQERSNGLWSEPIRKDGFAHQEWSFYHALPEVQGDE